MTDLPASWQTDPTGRHDHRYWDGTKWTDHVADAGVASSDPYTEPEPAATSEPADETATPLTWAPPAQATPAEPATPSEPETAEPDAGAAADAAADPAAPAAAATTPSGWSQPDEPSPAVPDGPAEASPVAGWAPASTPSSWSDPTSVGSTSDADAPTEVTATTDRTQALPTLPDPTSSFGGLAAEEPAPPIGPASTDGSDGTRRNILIGVGILVVVLIVAFLALSGDDDDSGSEAISTRLADSLQDGTPGLADDDADCLADHIVDEIGSDRLEGVDFDAENAPTGDVGTDFVEAYADATQECDVNPDGSSGAGDDDGTTPGGTDGDTIPDIGDLDSFRDLLADQYEQTLGLPRDKAECLADAMGEAVSDGQLDQQDAFGDFFDYLDSCDIALDEITGSNP
jgi:hypothetical protein